MFPFPIRIAALLLVALFREELAADDAPPRLPRLAFRLAETEAGDNLSEAVNPANGQAIFLHAENVLTDEDVTSVCFARDETGQMGLTLQFEAAAAKRLDSATQAHLGRPLAIVLDGKVISAPVVRDRISVTARISGKFSDAELTRMFSALVLHSEGAEPAR